MLVRDFLGACCVAGGEGGAEFPSEHLTGSWGDVDGLSCTVSSGLPHAVTCPSFRCPASLWHWPLRQWRGEVLMHHG